jgi:site-specific DNA recombinase
MLRVTYFLNCQTGMITQYDDKLVRRMVERVTILEGKVTIRFRSGVEVVVGV